MCAHTHVCFAFSVTQFVDSVTRGKAAERPFLCNTHTHTHTHSLLSHSYLCVRGGKGWDLVEFDHLCEQYFFPSRPTGWCQSLPNLNWWLRIKISKARKFQMRWESSRNSSRSPSTEPFNIISDDRDRARNIQCGCESFSNTESWVSIFKENNTWIRNSDFGLTPCRLQL